jgi:hypothetical protein
MPTSSEDKPDPKSAAKTLADKRAARLRAQRAPTYKDNPADPEEHANMEDDGKRFRVTGGAVGQHQERAIVGAKHLPRGAQINRLVRQGALAPLTDEEAEDHILNVEMAAEDAQAAMEIDQGRLDPANATGSPSGPAPKTAEPVPVSLALDEDKGSKAKGGK